jgi:hypothetical protein
MAALPLRHPLCGQARPKTVCWSSDASTSTSGSPRRKTRATVERVHGMYAMRCPLYRTLHTAIAMSSSCTLT